MTRAYLAFTAKGLALAEKLAAEYPGSVARCGHEPGQPGLADWIRSSKSGVQGTHAYAKMSFVQSA